MKGEGGLEFWAPAGWADTRPVRLRGGAGRSPAFRSSWGLRLGRLSSGSDRGTRGRLGLHLPQHTCVCDNLANACLPGMRDQLCAPAPASEELAVTAPGLCVFPRILSPGFICLSPSPLVPPPHAQPIQEPQQPHVQCGVSRPGHRLASSACGHGACSPSDAGSPAHLHNFAGDRSTISQFGCCVPVVGLGAKRVPGQCRLSESPFLEAAPFSRAPSLRAGREFLERCGRGSCGACSGLGVPSWLPLTSSQGLRLLTHLISKDSGTVQPLLLGRTF